MVATLAMVPKGLVESLHKSSAVCVLAAMHVCSCYSKLVECRTT